MASKRAIEKTAEGRVTIELQMNMTKKDLKKDIYLQKKDRKLLMICD